MFLSNTESTIMSVLLGVASEDTVLRHACLERFCKAYAQPLVQFLVATKGIGRDEAEDVVQDFWLAKVLAPPADNNLIAKYLTASTDRPDTSFRRYLARSLSLHFISRYRSAGEAFRRNALPLEKLEGQLPAAGAEQEEFDIAWANHILQRVLRSVQEECQRGPHRLKWEIFRALVLGPCLGLEKPSYAELAAILGISDPHKIGNGWITVKNMLHRHFRLAVQDYLPASTLEQSRIDAEVEVRELLLRLSSAGGLRLDASEWGFAAVPPGRSSAFSLDSHVAADLFRTTGDLQAAWAGMCQQNLVQIFQLTEMKAGTELTLEDLVGGQRLDLDLLNRLRQRCKQWGAPAQAGGAGEDERIVPREICGLAYLLSIAAAKVHLAANISSQSADRLVQNANKYATEPWVDPLSKTLLRRFVLPAPMRANG